MNETQTSIIEEIEKIGEKYRSQTSEKYDGQFDEWFGFALMNMAVNHCVRGDGLLESDYAYVEAKKSKIREQVSTVDWPELPHDPDAEKEVVNNVLAAYRLLVASGVPQSWSAFAYLRVGCHAVLELNEGKIRETMVMLVYAFDMLRGDHIAPYSNPGPLIDWHNPK